MFTRFVELRIVGTGAGQQVRSLSNPMFVVYDLNKATAFKKNEKDPETRTNVYTDTNLISYFIVDQPYKDLIQAVK